MHQVPTEIATGGEHELACCATFKFGDYISCKPSTKSCALRNQTKEARVGAFRALVCVGDGMHPDELVATYQLHAANCVEIAQRITDPESRLSLLAMAQSWLKLAEQAVKNSETVLVYETPLPKETP
jgi:hypothetical protein